MKKLRSIKFIAGLIWVSISGHALLLVIDVVYSMIVCHHQTHYFEYPATLATLATALLVLPWSIYGWIKCFDIDTKNRKPSKINIKYPNTVAILFLLLIGTDITHTRRFNSEGLYAYWTAVAIVVYLNKKQYKSTNTTI